MSFFNESVRNWKTVGSFTPSSKQLCREAISHIDFEETRFIVELGPGDGVITHHILNGMHSEAKLIVFEVNPKFCNQLREIDDKRLIIIEDSASKISEYLEQHDFARVDHIVSAIPFVVIPQKEAFMIIEGCRAALETGGKFIQVHYTPLIKRMYRKIFGNVDVNFVLMNFPPAFILVSIKGF